MSASAGPDEGLLHWRGTSEPTSLWTSVDWCDVSAGSVLVADSWRVIDGRARGLEHHLARFAASARPHRDDVDAFVEQVVAALPREGDWFPRVELRARGIPSPLATAHDPASQDPAAPATGLSLRLRATPATAREVVVATAPHDPRTRPLTKGPDLDALQRLRTAVQPRGAGEAIILSADGLIVEGAYSALLWWSPRGTLVQPSPALARIPSVTAALVLEAAAADGVTIETTDARPDDLAGCELWVLSALHGLRVATAWIDGPELVAEPGRAERGRRWLDEALAPLP